MEQTAQQKRLALEEEEAELLSRMQALEKELAAKRKERQGVRLGRRIKWPR
jgi:hypothetical protein